MFTLEGRLTLKQVVEQGFAEVRDQFLGQLKRAVEGLLEAERDRRIAELRAQGQKVYRWGYPSADGLADALGSLGAGARAAVAGSRRGGAVGEISAPRFR